MDRRRLLALGAGGLAATWLSGCTRGPSGGGGSMTAMRTLRYGDHPAQVLELTSPEGPSRGVVVVIHGGFWRQQYDFSLGRPLARSLAAQGWTAANLEYRRVGGGGGWPHTFDDVAAGIDALGEVEDLDTSTVITLGHSAGGHLAVWAAGRPGLVDTAWADPAVPVTAAVSQAGVLNLLSARSARLGDGAVADLMGEGDDDRYAEADPFLQLPLDVPVRCVHGVDDTIVPLEQSLGYVESATRSGADATLTQVAGDHFVLIDPASAAWAETLEVLAAL